MEGNTTGSKMNDYYIRPHPAWMEAVKGIMVVAIYAYLYYSNQNINLFWLCFLVYHLITPVVSLRDGSNHLTSVEYNMKTLTIIGMVTYSVSIVLLLFLSNDHAVFHSGFMMKYFGNIQCKKEFIVSTVVSSFCVLNWFFRALYCRPFNCGKSLGSTLYVFEDTMSEPIMHVVSLLFRHADDNNPTYTKYLVCYLVYKLIRVVREFNRARLLKSETIPRQNQIAMSTVGHEFRLPANQTHIWNIYGNTYDLTDFVQSHPGGKESIMLGANREDCTPLFQSYHAFNISKAKAILQKYQVTSSLNRLKSVEMVVNSCNDNDNNNNSQKDNESTSSSSTSSVAVAAAVDDSEEDSDILPTAKVSDSTRYHHENDAFYNILVERVAQKLKENNIDPIKDRASTPQRYVFYATYMMGVLWSLRWHLKGSIMGSIVFGIFGFFMGAWIGHDGGHFAVSRVPILNDIAVWGIGLICNPMMWQHQHTYGHHSFTNMHEKDPDLHHFHIYMRYHKNDPWMSFHRTQKYLVHILFTFDHTTLALCNFFVYRFILERSLHGTVVWSDQHRFLRTMGLLFHFVMYSAIIFVWPFFVMDSSWSAMMAGLSHTVTSGILFAILSQVGHINEHCIDYEYTKARRHPIAKESWAADQIESTNDFCPQSILWFYLGAQLSLQIEHHLFPGLNHCHLQLIQPVVEQTCKEYNVNYKKYDSFREILHETMTYLKGLSDPSPEVSSETANKKYH